MECLTGTQPYRGAETIAIDQGLPQQDRVRPVVKWIGIVGMLFLAFGVARYHGGVHTAGSRLLTALKDSQQNGGKTVEGAIEHLEADPLVLWGWTPGDGRSTPPLRHKEFLQKMREWVSMGAACPP
jgi:hypothetical protein